MLRVAKFQKFKLISNYSPALVKRKREKTAISAAKRLQMQLKKRQVSSLFELDRSFLVHAYEFRLCLLVFSPAGCRGGSTAKLGCPSKFFLIPINA